MIGEKGPDRRLAAERDQQQIAGDHRRQHQRQMHERVEQRFAPERLARQQRGDGDAERQRHQRRHHRNAQRQENRGPVLGGKLQHAYDAFGGTRKLKPYFSKIVLAACVCRKFR